MGRKHFLIVLVVAMASFVAGCAVGHWVYPPPEEKVDIISGEQAIEIARRDLDDYDVTIQEIVSCDLCVYHYPISTPPGKTPPPTLAYEVKFKIKYNNPVKEPGGNRWYAPEYAAVNVEAYTGKPIVVGFSDS